jgi:small subunit ribosomal protein S7
MPRRREVPKRESLPDPIYGSTLISKFVNCMMVKGKKSVAEGTFYGSLEIVKERTKDDPVKIFRKAMDNVKPVLEAQERRTSLAIRWIILNARSRGEKTMRERLAAEILDASNNRGGAIKKKEDTHRMAEANKAFAHYRW